MQFFAAMRVVGQPRDGNDQQTHESTAFFLELRRMYGDQIQISENRYHLSGTKC